MSYNTQSIYSQLRTLLCRAPQLGFPICVAPQYHILLLPILFRLGLRRLARSKRLFKVGDDIVNVFSPNRDPDQILCDTAIVLLLIT